MPDEKNAAQMNAEQPHELIISSQNMISPKVKKILRIMLAALVIYSVIYRSIYSWNTEIPSLLYFTIQSNLACALFWVLGSIFSKIRTNQLSLCVTTYIAATGIIFMLLLDGGFTQTIYDKLSHGKIGSLVHYYALMCSSISHYMIPLLAILDFLLFIDFRNQKPGMMFFVYPVCYFVLATVYAANTGKYVYPFLDPTYVGGLPILFVILVGILLVFLIINRGLYKLNKLVQQRIESYYRRLLCRKDCDNSLVN